MGPDIFDQFVKVAGGLTVIGGAAFGIYRVCAYVAATLRIVHLIGAQFKPNGGSSWDDKLTALVSGTNKLHVEFRSARDRLALVDARGDLALSGLDLGAMHFDVKGECYEVSEAIERHSGRTTEDLLGSGWLSCICPEDQARVAAQWADAVARRRRLPEEFSWLRADGSMEAVLFKARPVRRDGELIGFTAFLGRWDAVATLLTRSKESAERVPDDWFIG